MRQTSTQLIEAQFCLFEIVVVQVIDSTIAFHNLAKMALGLRTILRQTISAGHERPSKQVRGSGRAALFCAPNVEETEPWDGGATTPSQEKVTKIANISLVLLVRCPPFTLCVSGYLFIYFVARVGGLDKKK